MFYQRCCSLMLRLATVMFIVLIEVNGVQPPFPNSRMPRRQNSPLHRTFGNQYQTFQHQQKPNEPPQWQQQSRIQRNDNTGWKHVRSRREERSMNRQEKESWSFGPAANHQGLKMARPEPREYINRPDDSEQRNQQQWQWGKYQKEENTNEFTQHADHKDTPNYNRPPYRTGSFKDGLKDLDQFGHALFPPRMGGDEVSSFPELSVVRFRSSSISLGDNLEIVRIELDISDGEENEETKLEEVEDQ